MVATLMAGTKRKTKEDDDGTTMRIDRPALSVLNKITAMRGLKKVGDVFDERDVREFFNHLLLAEVKKEEQRLQGKAPK